jgi:hypothetical protein
MKVFKIEDVPQTGQQSAGLLAIVVRVDRTDQPRLLGLWRATMKNRWISLLLDEAPFPAIVLAFALGQSQIGVNPERAPLVPGQAPLAAQIDDQSEAGVNTFRGDGRVLPAFLPIERQIASSCSKRDGFLAINYNYGHPVIEYGQIGTHNDSWRPELDSD